MSLILGILAQSTGAAGSASFYESIATSTVGSGGSSTITFSSIPSTYTHLQLRSLARGTTSAADVETRITFNSDTGSNYSYHQVYGQGVNVPADGSANTSFIYYIYSPAANATASVFGGGVIDILDYANTNKYKTTRTLSGYDANGSGYILFRSGNWRNTNAITSIDIVCASGNFAQYSSFALYGIKGV
jgi:hypothetical protein